jgi:hypothetical protein
MKYEILEFGWYFNSLLWELLRTLLTPSGSKVGMSSASLASTSLWSYTLLAKSVDFGVTTLIFVLPTVMGCDIAQSSGRKISNILRDWYERRTFQVIVERIPVVDLYAGSETVSVRHLVQKSGSAGKSLHSQVVQPRVRTMCVASTKVKHQKGFDDVNCADIEPLHRDLREIHVAGNTGGRFVKKERHGFGAVDQNAVGDHE